MIVRVMESNTNLSALDLKGNTLGVDAAKAIGKALTKHTEFKVTKWNKNYST